MYLFPMRQTIQLSAHKISGGDTTFSCRQMKMARHKPRSPANGYLPIHHKVLMIVRVMRKSLRWHLHMTGHLRSPRSIGSSIISFRSVLFRSKRNLLAAALLGLRWICLLDGLRWNSMRLVRKHPSNMPCARN